MFLMFGLGRADILPVDDLGVRKGFMKMRGMRRMPAPEYLRRHGKRWAPYRTIASWYCWRAAELQGR
jgi:DNA-3-methyladenine glycosylase II